MTERVFQLVVRDEIADHARSVLTDDLPNDTEAAALDAAFFQRRFADRPTWVRWSTWAVGLAIIGPTAFAATILVFWVIRGIFP